MPETLTYINALKSLDPATLESESFQGQETSRRQYVFEVDSYNRPGLASAFRGREFQKKAECYQGPRTAKARSREILEADNFQRARGVLEA
ncbi:hypothetical protein J6590_053842 [Homalodisca vitripennis]|nr:hypothetical protein J6590_053842 [Homalodisca vitripennis]